MNQPPLTGSSVREMAMHSEDGALKRPFGIANWLISQRFACRSYLTIGSPLLFLAQS